MEKVIIIGAGPCGLSAAVELKKVNIDPLIIEKGSVVNSIYHYPTFMQFFSTPELLEIGGVPFSTPHEKPTRQEALTYYRNVSMRKDLRIRTYEVVESVLSKDRGFEVTSQDRFGGSHTYHCKSIIVATGYFGNFNQLDIPGENLSKVSKMYKEAHPYTGMSVAIIGGNNSAVDAAMDLRRAGAEVTVIYRGETYSEKIKPWVAPIFKSMVEKDSIHMLFGTVVKEIKPDSIVVETAGEERELANDFVFALIGYRPDRKLLQAIGVGMVEETGAPFFNPETMESNVPGIYIAGVIAAGNDANSIFIENGRLHGRTIAMDLAQRLGKVE